MTLSNKLSVAILLFSLSSLTLSIGGGLYLFQLISENNQEHKVSEVLKLIDYELLELTEPDYMAFWLPNWLKANNILKLELNNKKSKLFTYQVDEFKRIDKASLKHYKFTLQHSLINLSVWMQAPSQPLFYTPKVLFLLALLLAAMLLSMWQLILWLKRTLHGAELLEIRGKQLLEQEQEQKEMSFSQSQEWPQSAALAMDHLIVQLNDTKQDRSRFDSFIRKNAFIDPLTGLGNKIQLRNQLSSELGNSSCNTGVLLLIELPLLSDINHSLGEDEGDYLLQQTRDTLYSYHKRFTAPLLTRYSGHSFALLLPLMSSKDGENAAAAIIKLLHRIPLPEGYNSDHFYYIGVTAYQSTDSAYQILDELEMALRIARLQGSSSWHMNEKLISSNATGKGTVRWRSLLQNVIDNKQISLQHQEIVDKHNRHFANVVITKIMDDNGHLIEPSIFMPMAEKTGSIIPMENLFWQETIKNQKVMEVTNSPLFVPIHRETLQKKKFQRWLRMALLELPQQLRNHIVIQFSENQLGEQNSSTWQNLRTLKDLGCKLCIRNAGQAVISTIYIRELKVDYLKLHPGLIRRIDRNPMNQVAIRSLIASCADLPVKVLAEGVSTNKEWSHLIQLGVDGGQGRLFSGEQKI